MLEDDRPDPPRKFPFFSSFFSIFVAWWWLLFYTSTLLTLLLMIFILTLPLELSRPTPTEYHLFSTYNTLLPPEIMVWVPTIDNQLCKTSWGFSKILVLLVFEVADFHLTAFRLIFILYFEIVITVVIFEKLCILVLYIRSSSTDWLQVLGWVHYITFFIFVCLFLLLL